MRVSHPHVFRDGGGPLDNETSGHLLTAAFARFLLSVAADYHTFWAADQRVELTDSERQVIESGLRDLTVQSMLTQLVFEGTLTANITAGQAIPIILPFVPSVELQDFATWDNTTFRLYFPAAGQFSVNLAVALHSTPTGVNDSLVQIRRNGTSVAVGHGRRLNVNRGASVVRVITVSGGDYLDFRYINQGGDPAPISAGAAGTYVQVVKHG